MMMGSMDSLKGSRVGRIIAVSLGIIGILAIVLSVVLLFLRKEKNISASEDSALMTNEEYDDISGVFSVEEINVVDSKENPFGDTFKDDDSKNEALDSKPLKEVYLTFDDGPSLYTNRILDILDKYDVKATFFVLAKEDEASLKAYKRIVEDGHTLAMHSYAHKYSEVYESEESFIEDVSKIQEFLYEQTGVWVRIYRFPGGSSNEVTKTSIEKLIKYLNDVGITYFDWNIESGDAVSGRILSEQAIIQNCIRGIDKYDECVILMHDSYDRPTTVTALDDIIENILSRGDSVILPIGDETVPVQHRVFN